MNQIRSKPFLMNYADWNYRKSQNKNTKTALKYGFNNKIFSYSKKDIDFDFRRKNDKLLNYKKGDGYWVWKAYFIYKTLLSLNEDQYLFYCDSGAHFINDITPLIDISVEYKQDIVSFNQPNINGKYIKRDTFFKMNCDSEDFRYAPHKVASFHLWKRTDFSINFAKEFLIYSQDEDIITDSPNKCDLPNYKEFIYHRHDQAIFSLLCKKYNLTGFRDPSQWGNDFKSSFSNSNYGQLILHTRSRRKSLIERIEKFKKFLVPNYHKIKNLSDS
jgi:hypothetical protein